MKNIFITIVLSVFLFSCGEKEITDNHGHDHEFKKVQEDDHGHSHDSPAKVNDHGHAHDEPQVDEHDEEALHLNREQMETINLEFGEFTDMKVNDFIKTTGTLGLPPNAYSSVSPKAAGIIVGNKKFIEGNYIKKGAIIGYIENQDFILKQQDYLEAKAQLTLKKLNLDRQILLYKENAGVTKNREIAQAEYDIANAKANGLSKQLSYLGIYTGSLNVNNIKQQIPIYAPMSGYITTIDVHNGMYAEPTKSLMEIISDKHLHLELDVFEKDIAKIKKGQKISYTVPALGSKIYEGEVTTIGKEFDTKSKTVRIHGHLEGEKPQFLKDLFINAKIWQNDNTSSALPENAIIKDGANSLIFVGKENPKADEINFYPIRVLTRATSNGYTSVKLLDEIPEGMKIVTKGTYFVYAQSMAGELEHSH
ncbi:efflux RND transporter periplasmic adaptor subunit [Flavobacteriales bacterium]|nr:efflux RND transporter periplasmic adaptor subunit [Flavobacteriales bacterium]